MSDNRAIGLFIRLVGTISCSMILYKLSVNSVNDYCFLVFILHSLLCFVATLADNCDDFHTPTILKIFSLLVYFSLTYIALNLGHPIFAGSSILVSCFFIVLVE